MKFSGKIGFWEGDSEDSPGIYKPRIVEKSYYGDVESLTRRFVGTENQNDKFVISNRIHVISDLYMQEHFSSIRYIVWKGTKMSVSSVVIDYPRCTLEIGGLYNENAQKVNTP